MKNKTEKLALCLQLFAEGAGSGADGTGASGADNSTALAQQNDGSSSNKGTVPNAGVQNNAAENLSAEFEELIKGKYKQQFNDRTKDIIGKRMKNLSDSTAKLDKLAPALEILSKHYGCNADDFESLVKAIDADDKFLEDEAFANDIPVEQQRIMRNMKRENDALRKSEATLLQEKAERENREAFDRRMQERFVEGEKLKEFYPNFDFNKEMENKMFFDLICVPGISVRDAYETIHRDEIIPALLAKATKEAEQKVSGSIKANASRPNENGNSSQGAALNGVDVSQLTRKELDNYTARVMNGEKISFSK